VETCRVPETASVFVSTSWNTQIGKVIQSIGTPFFHEELICLLEITVATDAFWIIRYTKDASPDVVFTRGVSAHARRVYSTKCARIDPFSAEWQRFGKPGVFTLRNLRSENPACTTYSDIFLRAAEMDDELGVFLPVTTQTCFAVFLEREEGCFLDDEIESLRTVHSAINNFCKSHFDIIFGDTRTADSSVEIAEIQSPTTIFDHAGHHVFSNDGWDKATRGVPMLKQSAAKLALGGDTEFVSDGWVLRLRRMNSDFPLAPKGSMIVLEKAAAALSVGKTSGTPNLFSKFTDRERDVLRLMLHGMTNTEISAKLEIGIGTIRNVKLRLYRKSGVSSEGELVSKFMAFSSSI
jgi:DNA-binding CsgD family transcriptional regulator